MKIASDLLRYASVHPPEELVVELCPEAQLLLCCARRRLDDASGRRLRRILCREPDWNSVLEMAHKHGLAPLVYRHLRDEFSDAVPPEVLQKLAGVYHANARRNLFLTGRLLEFVRLFESAQIPVMTYKGTVLADYLYGDPALRLFTDLDLLVPKRNMVRAAELLLSQGFQPLNPLPVKRNAMVRRFECSFVHPESKTFVDLHWSIDPTYFSFTPDPESLWGRPASIAIQGHLVQTLAFQDLFFMLCIHGAKHYWERICWVCDLAELIKLHEDADWREIYETAQQKGNYRMVSLAVHLAHRLLGVPVPAGLHRQSRPDPKTDSLIARVEKHLFADTRHLDMIREGRRFFLKAMDRRQDKVRHRLDQVFSPTPCEWGLFSFPPQLHWLYFPARLIRLSFKYTLLPLRRLADAFTK